MLTLTPEEKRAAKQAKKAWKQNQKQTYAPETEVTETCTSNRIITGEVKGEFPMGDNDPVHPDFLYVINDDTGKVIKSPVGGTVLDLKKALRERGMKAEVVLNCNMGERNLY
jgi:hypothetical protein